MEGRLGFRNGMNAWREKDVSANKGRLGSHSRS